MISIRLKKDVDNQLFSKQNNKQYELSDFTISSEVFRFSDEVLPHVPKKLQSAQKRESSSKFQTSEF